MYEGLHVLRHCLSTVLLCQLGSYFLILNISTCKFLRLIGSLSEFLKRNIQYTRLNACITLEICHLMAQKAAKTGKMEEMTGGES